MHRNHRRPTSRLGALILAGTFALLISGCGSSDEGVWVNGTVTYRGKPFSNASITFYPATGRPIGASISDGKYSVQLPPGQYKVTVSLGVNLPPGWKEGDPVPPREITLPNQYTSVSRTQLSATVTENQQEPIDFALQ